MPAGSSIPPPFSGYWAWVRDELKTKASEKWVSSELSSLRRMFDDTKTVATDARKIAEKPYICNQTKEIEKLKGWQDKVSNWKIPVIISIVALIISAAGQYFSLKDSVDDGNQDRALMQETLKKIEEQQAESSKVIEDIKRQDEQREKKRNEELREMFKDMTSEMRKEPKIFRSKRMKEKTAKVSDVN